MKRKLMMLSFLLGSGMILSANANESVKNNAVNAACGVTSCDVEYCYTFDIPQEVDEETLGAIHDLAESYYCN